VAIEIIFVDVLCLLQYAALWCTNAVMNTSRFNVLVSIKDPTRMWGEILCAFSNFRLMLLELFDCRFFYAISTASAFAVNQQLLIAKYW